MKVFGLIGEKLSHSLSPIIHNNLYQILNLDATYSLYQVRPELLPAAVHGIQALDLQGVNVTIPYKVKIMEYLDHISPEAQKIGAINTIHNVDSCLSGYNTDYIGFGRMLRKYEIAITGKTAFILGSGGAAKAIAAYLEDMDCAQSYVVTRDPSKVVNFEKHKLIPYDQLQHIPQGGLLINCTPVGMYPHIEDSPLNIETVSKFSTVVDIVYNPFNTKLMQQAESVGIPTYNGLYMLVAQAVAAVEIWNNIKISEDIVDTVYMQLIEHIQK